MTAITTTPVRLTCSNCKGTYPETDFYRASGTKTGRQAYCKRCHRVKNKAARGDSATVRVYFTTTLAGRRAMHAAADAMRFTLNEWVRWACDLALERAPTPVDAATAIRDATAAAGVTEGDAPRGDDRDVEP